MKIRWLIRPKAKPGRSIEQLFTSLKPYFSEGVDIELCYLPGKGKLKKDMLLQRNFLQNLPAVDLTHVLGDIHYTAAWIKGRQVHTYHDIDSLLQGKKLSQWIKQYYWIKYPLKKAHGVSCVSKYTLKQIQNLEPACSSKMRVIYNALASDFSSIDESTQQILRQAQYDSIVEKNLEIGIKETSRQARSDKRLFNVLSIGTKANKNLLRCAEALKGIENVEWHIVGKLPEALKERIAENKLKVLNHSNLSDDALRAFYQEADLLLFPSLYEGFGLPIIEAQACGNPVITSNGTSMPEIAGEAALFVDPTKVDEIRRAVLRLMGDNSLREQLVSEGYNNIERFQIQDIADQYEAWYRSIVEGG